MPKRPAANVIVAIVIMSCDARRNERLCRKIVFTRRFEIMNLELEYSVRQPTGT